MEMQRHSNYIFIIIINIIIIIIINIINIIILLLLLLYLLFMCAVDRRTKWSTKVTSKCITD